jgi:prepilin-type N-terminal cleavage/methylation domain-containing protein
MSDHTHLRRGYSLTELLVVVAVLGLIAAIAVAEVRRSWQRARLDSAAGEVRAFIQSAYTFAGNNGAPVFIRLVPGGTGAVLQVTQNLDGSGRLFGSYTAPDFLNFSATTAGSFDGCTWPTQAAPPYPAPTAAAPGILEWDPQGRVLQPWSGALVSGAQTLVLTHRSMAQGELTPKIVHTLRVSALGQVTAVRSAS